VAKFQEGKDRKAAWLVSPTSDEDGAQLAARRLYLAQVGNAHRIQVLVMWPSFRKGRIAKLRGSFHPRQMKTARSWLRAVSISHK